MNGPRPSDARLIALKPRRALTVLRSFAIARPALAVALLAILGVTLYWSVVASDRYVSEAQVVVERTEMNGAESTDVASLLMNSSNNGDMLLLRAHLRSVDMMNRLDRELDLRRHFSSHGDVLSRLGSAEASDERFHRYYLDRVDVTIDEYAHLLRIRTQAYTPELAQAITQALVRDGEHFMNSMAHDLAESQVRFLEQQVDRMAQRVSETNERILAYQNETGLASPEATAQALTEITARIESQLSELRASRAAKLGFLSPRAAEIVQLDAQIGALEQQLERDRARLAAPDGKTLNSVIERSRKLQAEAEFAQDVYRTALLALERGRVEATRTIKKVSVLQTPSLPQDAVEPRRLYHIVLFSVLALGVAGIVQLLIAIIKDHQD